MQPLYSLLTGIASTFTLLFVTQPLPSFLLLLPIFILCVLIGWYLNTYIQKEHEKNIQKGFQYAVDEENADHWLHQSFIPKTKILLQYHIKKLIILTGVVLLLFVFFWTYFVAGLYNALLSIGITIILYTVFIFYLLHVEKWYRYYFKHIPKQYRHLKNNDWIHGYVILLPFCVLCNILYILFNYNANLVTWLLSLPIFFFVYTLTFLCLYCGVFLYREYQKEKEQTLEENVEKMLKE